MKSTITKYKEILGIIITICSVVVWAYSTFFTQKAASAQSVQVKAYIDARSDGQMELLRDLSKTVHRIDERVYNLKENKQH